jgi:hypothetical protein
MLQSAGEVWVRGAQIPVATSAFVPEESPRLQNGELGTVPVIQHYQFRTGPE